MSLKNFLCRCVVIHDKWELPSCRTMTINFREWSLNRWKAFYYKYKHNKDIEINFCCYHDHAASSNIYKCELSLNIAVSCGCESERKCSTSLCMKNWKKFCLASKNICAYQRTNENMRMRVEMRERVKGMRNNENMSTFFRNSILSRFPDTHTKHFSTLSLILVSHRHFLWQDRA